MSGYSKENYTKLFLDFLRDKKYKNSEDIFRKIFDRDRVYQADLLEDDRSMEESIQIIGDLIVKEFVENSISYKYLMNYRNYLLLFFEWAMDKGYISWQPFDSNFLSGKVLLSKAAAKMNILVPKAAQIDVLCERFTSNSELYEILIRGFFEGISDALSLYELRWSDVNYNEKTLILNGERRKFSSKFMDALQRYYRTEEFVVERSNGGNYSIPMEIVDDRLIKNIARKNSRISIHNFRKNLTMHFGKISQCTGRRVNAEILYKAGFLSYVYQNCEEDRAVFLELFLDVVNVRSNKNVGKMLEEYAKKYHLNQNESKYIRRDYCLLALKFNSVNDS